MMNHDEEFSLLAVDALKYLPIISYFISREISVRKTAWHYVG
jgi:hypothetical protein